ncbi:MAG: hypothetical protein ACPG46_01905 [Thalassotalea sp.]
MEIQSALNSGVQGFQNAQEQANTAAANIAQAANFNDQAQSAVNSEESVSNTITQSAKAESLPDLNQNIVDLKVAEFQAKASANVVKTADETLGTLLDVTV